MGAKGEGNEKLHHSPGDAVFIVVYGPHKRFTVDPDNPVDLVYTERIKLVDALLGFSYVAAGVHGSARWHRPLVC